MQLSYNWLKEFLSGLKLSPEKLAGVLNLHVAQVEKVEKLGEGLDKVIVAEIIEIKPHPNADKLQIVKVKTKYQSTQAPKYLTIVCGASNIKLGQKVPLALPGARLANGIEIKESIIRGIKSQGMLCAEDELGVGEDHTGIYILPEKTKLGVSLKKVLGLDDAILEIENKSLTHRPDLFNHIGFAREISACLGQVKLKISAEGGSASGGKNAKVKTTIKNLKLSKDKKILKIKVEDKKLCPRYMAVIMDGVKITPSPEWMQARLRNLGIRPINNVVDITNYVMIELGQPLHAFDYDKLKYVEKLKIKNKKSKTQTKNQKIKQIIIRRAKKEEKILALDGKEYEIGEEDLVIADSSAPIAIAGVMGGEASGVTEETKTIVIESANFDPVAIRRTSWRLGLRTDSALRFEKGLALRCPCAGLRRAQELVEKLAQGVSASKIFDLKTNLASKELRKRKKIILRFDYVNRLIGQNISTKIVVNILRRLGFKIFEIKKDKIRITVPGWRKDISLEEDLIEEIVRIYGINKIKPGPILAELKPVKPEIEFVLEKKLRNILVGMGFDEVYNYSFYSAQIIDEIGSDKEKHLKLSNPLSPDQQYLRASLIQGLVKNAKKNSKNFPEFKIFEIGRVFNPEEKKKIAGLIYPEDYGVVKGVLELIFDRLGVEETRIIYKAGPPGSEFLVSVDSKVIGSLGLSDDFSFFELDFDSLARLAKEVKKYQPVSAFPPIKRDLAFLIDKKNTWDGIVRTVKGVSPLIQQIELFDVFEDKRFGGKHNLAFHIIYQSYQRTLKAEEIDKIQTKIIKTLEEKFNAQLRNF